MNQFPAEYFPKGPASSYRLRAYAEQCYQEYVPVIEETSDKYSFMKSMESLNNTLLGLDTTKHDNGSQSRHVMNHGATMKNTARSAISTRNRTNARTRPSNVQLTEEMKAVSSQSLEKIKEMRNMLISSLHTDRQHLRDSIDSEITINSDSDIYVYDHLQPAVLNHDHDSQSDFVMAMDRYQAKSSMKKSVRFNSSPNHHQSHHTFDDDEEYSINDSNGDTDDNESTSSSVNISSPILPIIPESSAKIFVRVLWDLENVSIPRRYGGLNVVEKIRDFLAKKGLLGIGIDTRVTGFFSPDHKTMAAQTIEELDKAGVELVWVSTKREDADRKIGYRISQEMHVLKDVKNTVFVIISSDQDFRHHMLLLLNEGYRVIIIHNAPPGRWTQALEMQASEAYRWQDDVFGGVFPGKKKASKPRNPSPTTSKPAVGASDVMAPESLTTTPLATTTIISSEMIVNASLASKSNNIASHPTKEVQPEVDASIAITKVDPTSIASSSTPPNKSARRRSRSKSPLKEDANTNEVTAIDRHINTLATTYADAGTTDKVIFDSGPIETNDKAKISCPILTTSTDEPDAITIDNPVMIAGSLSPEPRPHITHEKVVWPTTSQSLKSAVPAPMAENLQPNVPSYSDPRPWPAHMRTSYSSPTPPVLTANTKVAGGLAEETRHASPSMPPRIRSKSPISPEPKRSAMKGSNNASHSNNNLPASHSHHNKTPPKSRPENKDSVDLSNMTFERLKELTGHY